MTCSECDSAAVAMSGQLIRCHFGSRVLGRSMVASPPGLGRFRAATCRRWGDVGALVCVARREAREKENLYIHYAFHVLTPDQPLQGPHIKTFKF